MNDNKENLNLKEWAVSSWKDFKISQQPVYQDLELLESVKNKVRF